MRLKGWTITMAPYEFDVTARHFVGHSLQLVQSRQPGGRSIS